MQKTNLYVCAILKLRTEGDDVLVANETGSLSLHLAFSEALPRGVALSHKGRWPKREAARANVNVLNPGYKTDMGESTLKPATRG